MQSIEKMKPRALSSAEASTDLLPRICLLTETYYPVTGGGETQLRMLAERLLSHGFRVFVIARRSSRSFKANEDLDGVVVYRIPPVGVGRFKRWAMLVWSMVALTRMRSSYDILYVSGFKALGISAVLASKMFRKVCILKADSNGEMSGAFFTAGLRKLSLARSSPLFRGFLFIRNKILRRADIFVAITSGIAEEFKNHGVHPDTIHSIPNGVNTKRFRPVADDRKRKLRQQLNLPNKEMLIAYCGRLVSYKGVALLLRVAQSIHRTQPNVGFVIVGSGGFDIHNCEAELKEYVVINGLEKCVAFAGEVNNVHEFLQAADIFAFPTEKDAFPLALVEAMASGLAVISTPVGGIREIITNGRDGLLVEAGNCQQLYDAIQSLISDPALTASLGKAAAQTVNERYSETIILTQYIELFRKVSKPVRARVPTQNHA